MKTILITLLYRYHYWTFELKRFLAVLFFFSIIRLLSIVFPSLKKSDASDYSNFNNPKNYYAYYIKSKLGIHNSTVVDSAKASPLNFTTCIVLYTLAITFSIRTLNPLWFIIALLITGIGDFVYEKTGYAFTFGPEHK